MARTWVKLTAIQPQAVPSANMMMKKTIWASKVRKVATPHYYAAKVRMTTLGLRHSSAQIIAMSSELGLNTARKFFTESDNSGKCSVTRQCSACTRSISSTMQWRYY